MPNVAEVCTYDRIIDLRRGSAKIGSQYRRQCNPVQPSTASTGGELQDHRHAVAESQRRLYCRMLISAVLGANLTSPWSRASGYVHLLRVYAHRMARSLPSVRSSEVWIFCAIAGTVKVRICHGSIVCQQAASGPAKAPAFPRKRPVMPLGARCSCRYGRRLAAAYCGLP